MEYLTLKKINTRINYTQLKKLFKKMNKLYFIFFISILIFSSCKHELETPSWDVDLITPIANSNVSIDQIVIEDSFIKVI